MIPTPRARATALAVPIVLLLAAFVGVRASWASDGVSFLMELSSKPRANREDLIRVAARFKDTSQPSDWLGAGQRAESLESARADLKSQGLIGDDYPMSTGLPVRQGEAALLFARALKLRGGVGGKLWGMGPRAAYRELVDLEILPPGGGRRQMSGAELIALLDRAREFARRRRNSS